MKRSISEAMQHYTTMSYDSTKYFSYSMAAYIPLTCLLAAKQKTSSACIERVFRRPYFFAPRTHLAADSRTSTSGTNRALITEASGSNRPSVTRDLISLFAITITDYRTERQEVSIRKIKKHHKEREENKNQRTRAIGRRRNLLHIVYIAHKKYRQGIVWKPLERQAQLWFESFRHGGTTISILNLHSRHRMQICCLQRYTVVYIVEDDAAFYRNKRERKKLEEDEHAWQRLISSRAVVRWKGTTIETPRHRPAIK